MHRSILFTAALGSALTLAACGEPAEEPVDTDLEAPAPETTAVLADGEVGNPNTMTAEQLVQIDGVSAELAETIVAGQPYDTAVSFNETLLGSVSEEEAAALREILFVPVNLNTASEDDIALIPGMTDRMRGEFLEYRPYGDINDFNREIGKYVDRDEVERFRKYVTL